LNPSNPISYPHRRKNILTGDWILVSPHRTQRPWQGEVAPVLPAYRPQYDPQCYLCPGNKRANGDVNPQYDSTFVFTNDYSSLLMDIPADPPEKNPLLQSKGERGICRVVNFSPRHDLTLAEMSEEEIRNVITVWQKEYSALSKNPHIKYVQIFENKGSMMGNSNPHPHCQIWAQESIPMEPAKELHQFSRYYAKTKRSLLSDYLKTELKSKERIVYENSAFVAVVPFWAVWPYETMIISRRKIGSLHQFKDEERSAFANIIGAITAKYDNLFETSFPYSSGLHQSPTDGKDHPEWHFHMHFYPPLLRSAQVKKFMVGYEMMAEPQRDSTPEQSAKILRELSSSHYKYNNASNERK